MKFPDCLSVSTHGWSWVTMQQLLFPLPLIMMCPLLAPIPVRKYRLRFVFGFNLVFDNLKHTCNVYRTAKSNRVCECVHVSECVKWGLG